MPRISHGTPMSAGGAPGPPAAGCDCGPDSTKGYPGVPGERPQTDGGGACNHCVHVTQLLERMNAVEAILANAGGDP